MKIVEKVKKSRSAEIEISLDCLRFTRSANNQNDCKLHFDSHFGSGEHFGTVWKKIKCFFFCSVLSGDFTT